MTTTIIYKYTVQYIYMVWEWYLLYYEWYILNNKLKLI